MTSHCNNKTLFLIEHGTNIHFIGLQDGDAHDQNRKNETWHTLANDSGSIDLGIWTSIYNFGDKWQYNTIHQTSYDAFKMNESHISLKLILNQLKTLYFSSFFWNKIWTFLINLEQSSHRNKKPPWRQNFGWSCVCQNFGLIWNRNRLFRDQEKWDEPKFYTRNIFFGIFLTSRCGTRLSRPPRAQSGATTFAIPAFNLLTLVASIPVYCWEPHGVDGTLAQ